MTSNTAYRWATILTAGLACACSGEGVTGPPDGPPGPETWTDVMVYDLVLPDTAGLLVLDDAMITGSPHRGAYMEAHGDRTSQGEYVRDADGTVHLYSLYTTPNRVARPTASGGLTYTMSDTTYVYERRR